MKNKTAARATAALMGGALIAGGAFAAAPANAASYDDWVETETVGWEYVNLESGFVEDDYFTGYATGFDSWVDHAFDAAGQLDVYSCGEWGTPDEVGSAQIGPVDWNEGGVSSFTSAWTWEPSDCTGAEVNITATFKGNYVKWDYTFENVQAVHWGANSNFDDDAEWTIEDPKSAAGWDATDMYTPAAALQFVTDGSGASLETDEDELDYNVNAPTSLSVYLLVADHTWGSGVAAAYDFMKTAAPTLKDTFGAIVPAIEGTDAPAFSPQTLKTGVAVDQTVDYDYTPMFSDEDVEYFLSPEAYDDWSEFMDYRLGDIPAGLKIDIAFDVETGLPLLRLSGTPTQAGTYDVPVTFFVAELRGETLSDDVDQALHSNIRIVVEDPAAPAVDDKKALAETGFDGAPLGYAAAALLIMGLGAMGARRTRKA